jgi:hypothetical protein
MKPDKLDIKIQEAAAQYVPVYNEQTWSIMERILDEKMPQKKNKRKIFWIFILSLLFLGTGSLLLINYMGGNTQQVVLSEVKETVSAPSFRNILQNSSNTIIKKLHKEAMLPHQTIQQIVNENSFSKKSFQNIKRREKIIENVSRNKNAFFYRSTKDMGNKDETDFPMSNLGKNHPTEHPYNSESIGNIIKESSLFDTNNQTGENEKNNSLVKENKKDTFHKKISAQKKRNKFINSFALAFSSGPDVSAVELSNVGKINLTYGAGISYQLSKRLTLRTGFYVERKVYDAKVSDYHPPARFWNYYPDLKYIDADCKIYEVPLLVNYNFSQTPKYQWFGSAGISSFFMKKEDYNYVSKSPSGQTSYNNYTITNKYQHYLSTIRLSVGYERKVKNNISILAEPYLALPLTGVGYGKVKLYSAGILFTINIKPFAQKK